MDKIDRESVIGRKDRFLPPTNPNYIPREEVIRKVRDLLESYYSLKGPDTAGIGARLEGYFLNGREIIGLVDELAEFTPKYIELKEKVEELEQANETKKEAIHRALSDLEEIRGEITKTRGNLENSF